MIEKHSNAKMQVWQRGFKYTLTNGYTLSCAFGWGNYCGNRDCMGEQIEPSQNKWEVSCEDFEVAVFEPNGDMVDLIRTEPDEDGFAFNDQVLGWVPASALPRLIQVLKYWPVRPTYDLDADLPADVLAARQQTIESFEHSLRNRCTQFCFLVKNIQDEVDKEDQAASEQADRHA